MSKHTPGPWKWWDEQSGRPPNYDLMHLDGPNGKQILGCYGGPGFEALGKTKEDKANARLIAAAPDLLAALCEIAKGEGAFSRDPLEHASNVIDNMKSIALAAIAKAESPQ